MYRLLAVALLTLCSGSVHAFESNEHKRIGDLSYHIALKSFCAQKPGSPVCDAQTGLTREAGLFFNPFAAPRGNEDTRPTYGDLVMCVDYFLSAEKLIAGREDSMIRPYITPTRDSLYPASADELELAVSVRCSAALDNWEGARAGHVNHNHFQEEVLLAQRNNHGLSLYLAATGTTIFSALAVNAISDHYLHDTFAPGHITTWRNKLSDVVANSYHDYRNRHGLNVDVRVDVLRSNATLGASAGKPTVLDTAFEVLASNSGADHFFCEHEAGREHPPCTVGSGARASRLAALRTFANGASPVKTLFKGDKFLYADNKDQDIQRFVMLLTAVRSIHDVLESHNRAPLVVLKDSFRKSTWTWNYAEDDNGGLTPLPPSAIVASTGPVQYQVARRYSIKGEPRDLNTIDNHNVDKIFGVNLGIDNMTFGNNQSRYYAGLEAVLAGFTLFDGFRGRLPLEKDIGNLAWTVGIQPFVSPGPNGVALTSRLLMILPETETAFSLQLKALRLAPVGQRHTWRPYVGLRMDMGLTSFMTMYLQAGKDAAVQRDGSIRSGPSVGGGIQLGAPTCRIPGIQKIFCP